MSNQARILREQPYRAESERALERRMETGIRPATLKALLHWYAEALGAETPDALHSPGVWRDWGPDGQGGSALGSPRLDDGFRRYIEGSERQTDVDGRYAFPVRAALKHLAEGRPGRPLVARFLWRVARCGFDWHLAADSAKLPHEYAAILVKGGLELLWERCLDMPPHRARPDERQAAVA